MRIFRGLENIHSVIDRHEAEWRKDNGEEPETPRKVSLEETVRRRLTSQPKEGSGRFAADRFLGGKVEPVKHEEEKPVISEPLPEPEEESGKFSADRFLGGENEPETLDEPEAVSSEPEVVAEPVTAEPEAVHVESDSSVRHSWLYNEVMKAVNEASKGSKDTKVVAVFVPVIQNTGEAREIPADDSEFAPDDGENARAVEIIRNKDGKHSRLYDEVMRAVNDSAGDSRKIVAVFVPLLQDGREFEDLPADETVTLPPISEDAVKVEAPHVEETPAEVEDVIAPEDEPEISSVPEFVPEEIPEPAPEILEEILAQEPEITDETQEQEETSAEDFDLIPEGQAESDKELAEAFREMEKKLDEDIQEEHEQEVIESEPEVELEPEVIAEPEPEIITESEPEQEPEIITEPEEEPEITVDDDKEIEDDDDIPDGEPMEFEDINTIGSEEITLPDALDDDEVLDDGEEEFDESLTEVHKADDDDEETIVIEENDDGFFTDDEEDDEIELIPDPVK
ncbi:MAG: hypothetical protein II832_06700 [Synergistaceae bacterium]|nr:hypothetical protein [Synergistaceae bacterium]